MFKCINTDDLRDITRALFCLLLTQMFKLFTILNENEHYEAVPINNPIRKRKEPPVPNNGYIAINSTSGFQVFVTQKIGVFFIYIIVI